MTTYEYIVIIVSTSAVIAGLYTWRATRTYARLAGIALFMEHYLKVASEGDSASRRASIDVMKMVRDEFPDVYKDLGRHVGADTRRKIETE